MNAEVMKTRFAPSPTGMLHVGSARTALFNNLLAGRRRGVFLLRIEDTDPGRSTADYAVALQQDLQWLGLQWQEGPGILGLHESYLQSQRGAVYRSYFDLLEQQGMAYLCFCSEQELKMTRKSQLAAGRPPRYPGTCARLSREEVVERLGRGLKPTLRFRVPVGQTVTFDDMVRGEQHFATDDIGDFVVRRSDGTPAFFFCNAVDDSLMGVTHVLRGEDHLTNTPRQILLLNGLGLRAPRYGHIAMIVGDDGAPLSKRHGSLSIRELKQQGYLPEAVNNYLARLGHHYEDSAGMSLEALAAGFDVKSLGRAPARYDGEQLLHWQRDAVGRTGDAALWDWMGDDVHAVVPAPLKPGFVEAVRANITFPADARAWARILFSDDYDFTPEARQAAQRAGAGFFNHAVAAFDRVGEDVTELVDGIKRLAGVKGKLLFLPLRAALTGRTDGPGLVHILTLLTRERIRRRLELGARLTWERNQRA